MHNTEDCYFKKPAAKSSKEANMIEEMKKEIESFKKIIKNFGGPDTEDSDSEWLLHKRKKQKMVYNVEGPTNQKST